MEEKGVAGDVILLILLTFILLYRKYEEPSRGGTGMGMIRYEVRYISGIIRCLRNTRCLLFRTSVHRSCDNHVFPFTIYYLASDNF